MRIAVGLFAGSILFIASASIAVSESRPHCQRHLTQSGCGRDGSGECFWNHRANRCQYRSNAAAECLQMNHRECLAHEGVCQWHARHHQCEGRWN